MLKTIKIRAQTGKDGLGVVKSIITHPMETGLRINQQTKKAIPANYIDRVIALFRGNIVFDAYLGRGVSKNPYFSFKVPAAEAGEEIRLTWHDNLGTTDTATALFS